jgi:hypothetical protein
MSTAPASFVLAAALIAGFAGVAGAEPARPQRARPPAPVLGVRHSFGRSSRGWGEVRPDYLFNGGDPSGEISDIHWAHWGGKTARGSGKNPIFKPGGGYYRHPVTIKLRVTDPGPCGPTGAPGYHHMFVKEPRKPRGRDGRWHAWTSYHRNLCKEFR